MKKVLSVMIPYGVEHPSFVNYEIRENMEVISYGRLYLDGTAYVSCWGSTSYMVDEVDASIIYDFVDGKKSSEDISNYLHLAYLEMEDITKAELNYPDEAPREDLHTDYLMHNFGASSMDEVEKKLNKNNQKLKKMLYKVLDNIK